MIEIKDLSKTYTVGRGKNKKSITALDKISLKIEDGESVAIQGKSGAGKSTLLNILGLLDSYDKGSYLFNNTDVNNLSDKKSAKLRNSEIGFVLQDFSLIDQKTVLTNVTLPLYFNDKYTAEQMKEKALDVLDSLGIKDQADKKASQLSGGQRQRVSIARALITEPSVILADEPTGSLDSDTAQEIMRLLMELNEKKHITLIVVTHDKSVAEYCKRRIFIADGKCVTE